MQTSRIANNIVPICQVRFDFDLETTRPYTNYYKLNMGQDETLMAWNR